MKNIKLLLFPLLMSSLYAAETAPKGEHILVEAEAFASPGGWVVDPQFMDIMGSPYLLAHGLGQPVADATTEVDVQVAGTYRIWVRTKDWVAQWKAPGAPGKFQVLVNGKTLEPTFGTVGAQWHWQEGGAIELQAGKNRIALHDLTGFEGRCDAVLFSRDAAFVPPNADPEMAVFRRKCLGLPEQPEAAGEFDLVVTGGGISGTCAALSAARSGLKVALIQDRPVLGGNNSSEVRVWLQGARNKEPWPRIGDVVSELEQKKSAHYGPSNTKEIYEDEKKLALVRAETNITLVLDHRVNAAEVVDGRIRAVIAQSTSSGRRLRFVAKYVADCTGDAAVGALAGADFELEPKGHMGPCNLWNVAPSKEAVSFPRCPWALDLTDKPFPGRGKGKPDPHKLGGWYWESGFDRDPMQEMEYVRDWNFRAMYGAWDALKNVDKVLPDYTLNWSAYILGKRESRRLMGDVVLTWDDLVKDRQFPDAAAPTGWSNDLHLPDPAYEKGFKGDAFISHALFGQFPAYKEKRPFWIPYRSLYSRNITNLFMAGRCISVKHEALGAVRVMRTGGCMGEVVGMAASLCVKHDAPPRAVYEKHLPELQDLMRLGAGASQVNNLAAFEIMMKIVPSLERNIEVRAGLLISFLRFSGARSRLSENGPQEFLKQAGLYHADLKDEISVLYKQIAGLMQEGASKDEIINDLLQSYSIKDKLDRSTMITHLVIHGTYIDKDEDYEVTISKLMSVKEKEAYAILCSQYKGLFLNEVSEFLRKRTAANEIANIFVLAKAEH